MSVAVRADPRPQLNGGPRWSLVPSRPWRGRPELLSASALATAYAISCWPCCWQLALVIARMACVRRWGWRGAGIAAGVAVAGGLGAAGQWQGGLAGAALIAVGGFAAPEVSDWLKDRRSRSAVLDELSSPALVPETAKPHGREAFWLRPEQRVVGFIGRSVCARGGMGADASPAGAECERGRTAQGRVEGVRTRRGTACCGRRRVVSQTIVSRSPVTRGSGCG